MWLNVSMHGPPLWLLLSWQLGELAADRRVTHWEAKHSRFTRVISAGEITAHTYRNPRAEIPPRTTNTKAEVGHQEMTLECSFENPRVALVLRESNRKLYKTNP